MEILERLRERNRTVLEMQLGILFYGIVCQVIGAFMVENQMYYARSLWFGIIMANVSVLHMYRTLDAALGSGQTEKIIRRGYMIRYVALIVIMFLVMWTEVMNPLIVFMAYMSLKVTAFIQPFTHKLCNRVFRESDPVPVSMDMDMPIMDVPKMNVSNMEIPNMDIPADMNIVMTMGVPEGEEGPAVFSEEESVAGEDGNEE